MIVHKINTMLQTSVLLMFLPALILDHAKGALYSPEALLIHSLLSNSSKFARPTKNASQSVKVEFGVELVQVQEIQMMPVQSLKTNVWIRMKWVNELFRWNSDYYGGVKSVMLDADSVWVPDIVLYNRYDVQEENNEEASSNFLKTQVNLLDDGTVYWKAPATFISTCQLDVADFPYDVQSCHLKFGPWNSDVSKVDVFADSYPLTTTAYIESSEWRLEHISKQRNFKKYACCANGFSDVTVKIKLRRKPLFYLFNFVVPYVVLLSCLWIGYFVPPQSGERISLSLTILLAFSIFIQTSSMYLPRSAELSSLSILYFVLMNEVAVSALITCLIVNVFYTSDWGEKAHMPRWVEQKFLNFFETFFKKIGLLSRIGNNRPNKSCLRPKYRINSNRQKKTQNPTDSVMKSAQQTCGFDSSGNGKSMFKNKSGTLWASCVDSGNSEDGTLEKKGTNDEASFQANNADHMKEERKLQSILELLKNIKEQKQNDLVQTDSGDKWKRLAAVLDRLSFLIFSFFTIFTFLAFTAIRPSIREHSH